MSELEKNKKEGLTAIQMKEKEMAAIAAKIEDEQSLGSKMQKQVDRKTILYRQFMKSRHLSGVGIN